MDAPEKRELCEKTSFAIMRTSLHLAREETISAGSVELGHPAVVFRSYRQTFDLKFVQSSEKPWLSALPIDVAIAVVMIHVRTSHSTINQEAKKSQLSRSILFAACAVLEITTYEYERGQAVCLSQTTHPPHTAWRTACTPAFTTPTEDRSTSTSCKSIWMCIFFKQHRVAWM